MKTPKEKIKEMEEDFEEHSTKIGNISGRKEGVDYTEWRILKSKLETYKEAISDIRTLIEKMIDKWTKEKYVSLEDVKEILSEIEGGKQEK